MKLKMWQQNVLSALIIAVGGFVLWNIAFILAALVMRVYMMVIGSFEASGSAMLWKYLLLIVVLLISFFILRAKKLKTLIKATYLTMPLMVLLILIGIQFWQQPKWVPITLGGAIVIIILFYLYKKKLTWQYYFATIFTASTALFVVLADIQI